MKLYSNANYRHTQATGLTYMVSMGEAASFFNLFKFPVVKL